MHCACARGIWETRKRSRTQLDRRPPVLEEAALARGAGTVVIAAGRGAAGGESGIGASGIPGLGHGVDRASIMANGIGTQRCTRDEAESGKGGERSEAQKGFHGRRRGVVGPGASLTLQDRNCGTFDGPRSSANQLWGLRVLAQTDDGIWGAERRRPRDVDRGHLRRGARWSFPPSPRVGDRS